MEKKRLKRLSDTEFNAIIGGDEMIEGDISCEGNLKIDCLFRGTINSKGIVFVGNNGEVQADIRCYSVIIGGKVNGKIVAADKIEVRRTGVLSGDIECDMVAVEESSSVTKPISMKDDNSLVRWNTWLVYKEKRKELMAKLGGRQLAG